MTLSRNDTAFLKGIAILMIVIHNFCHWLPMAVPENEYTFDATRIWQYWEYLQNGRPHLVLNFFSHFGHYGVALFLFLSGYGLVKKYERNEAPKVSVLRFMTAHALKLWKLMVPAILLFILTETIFRDGFSRDWKWVVHLLTYTSNLVPVAHFIMGPWWFFSLILQCYLLYRLVFFPFRKGGVLWGVTLATLAVQVFFYAADIRFSWNGESVEALTYLRYNAPGHLFPFALGIGYARQEFSVKALPVLLTGVVLTIVSAFNVWLWLLSPLFALMTTLPLAQIVGEGKFRRLLQRIGPISAAIFALHPIVRHYTILPACRALRMEEPTLVYGAVLFYLLVTLLLAWSYTRLNEQLSTSRHL